MLNKKVDIVKDEEYVRTIYYCCRFNTDIQYWQVFSNYGLYWINADKYFNVEERFNNENSFPAQAEIIYSYEDTWAEPDGK